MMANRKPRLTTELFVVGYAKRLSPSAQD